MVAPKEISGNSTTDVLSELRGISKKDVKTALKTLYTTFFFCLTVSLGES